MSNKIAGETLFSERLGAIHGLSEAARDAASIDTGRAEMLAMFDAFLGENFDASKKERVISMQRKLHRDQALLAKRLEQHDLSAADYVDEFNRRLAAAFDACEATLGAADFEALFGAPPASMAGFIDKPTFLAALVAG